MDYEKENNGNVIQKKPSYNNVNRYKNTNDFKKQNELAIKQKDSTYFETIPDLAPGYYFIPLGGTDMIGMNFNVFGIVNADKTESWIVCDIGISILRENGLRVEMASPAALMHKNIDAIIITHAHDDHHAGVVYVLDLFQNKHIPLYATKFGLSVMKFKLEKFKSMESSRRTRDHQIIEDLEDDEEFFIRYHNNFSLIEVKPNEPFICGFFRVTLLYITHSTLESNMVKIEFSKDCGKKFDYVLLHTADWKNDCTPVLGQPANLALIKKNCSNINMILCDSTNANKPGNTPSELGVEKYLQRLLKKYRESNKILVSFFATNVARMKTVITLAKAENRQIVIYGTSMIGLFSIAHEHGYISSEDFNSVLKGVDINMRKNERFLVVCTGSQGEETSVLNRLSQGTFRYLKLSDTIEKKDLKNSTVVIFASSIIPGNDNYIATLKNRLLKKGIIVVDTLNDGIFLEKTLNNNEFLPQNSDGFIHVSGHPCRDDVKAFINIMKPDGFIPVHGDTYHIVALRDLALSVNPYIHTVIPFDGAIIHLNGKMGPNSTWIPIVLPTKKIIASRLYADGTSIIPDTSAHLKVRETLGKNGALFIQICEETSQIVRIHNIGAIPVENHHELTKITYNINARMAKEFNNEEDLKQAIKNTIYRRFAKEPFIKVFIA